VKLTELSASERSMFKKVDLINQLPDLTE
jgi:hypothetical protein